MTAQTQGLTAQGLAASPSQQGWPGAGFPPPIGAEQFSGVPQVYGTQVPYGFQHPTSQHWQQGQGRPDQQVTQQLAQILAIAQQIIVPQAAAVAVQQAAAVAVQQAGQQLQYLVAQIASQNSGQQAGQFGAQQFPGQQSPGHQFPGYFTGQQAAGAGGQQFWGQQQQPWGQHPMAGLAGQPGQAYAHLS